MNIYEKLQKVKIELSKTKLNKTGRNDFSKYSYFELGDFLPKIVELLQENLLASLVSFPEGKGTLTIINVEKPDERVVVETPMSSANLKGCHEVQNLGAVQTYLRRYLYVAAFDIVENDVVDAAAASETKASPSKPASKPGAQSAENDMPINQVLIKLPTKEEKTLIEMTKGELNWVIGNKELARYHEMAKTILEKGKAAA